MSNPFPIEQLRNAIVGKTCWATVAGEGVGSVFQIYLGAKVPRERPKKNQHLSQDARKYDPEYSLMVWCPWHLESVAGPITNWLASNANDGPMVLGLQQLEGETVLDASVMAPKWDLTVSFSGEKRLSIVADSYDETGILDEWSVLGPAEFCLAVTSGGKWTDHDDVVP